MTLAYHFRRDEIEISTRTVHSQFNAIIISTEVVLYARKIYLAKAIGTWRFGIGDWRLGKKVYCTSKFTTFTSQQINYEFCLLLQKKRNQKSYTNTTFLYNAIIATVKMNYYAWRIYLAKAIGNWRLEIGYWRLGKKLTIPLN